MDNFARHPYEYNVRLFQLIGLASNDDKNLRLRRICIICFIFFLAIVIQIILLATSEMGIQRIADLMQTFLPTICFSACYCNILYHDKLAEKIRVDIRQHLTKLCNQEEVNLIKKYTKQNTKYSIIITCAFYLYICILFLPSFWSLYMQNVRINNTELVLPVRIEYCLQNRSRYFSMLFLQWAGISIICTVGIAYYSMVIACVQHACSMFALVSVKIDQPLRKKSLNYPGASPVCEEKREVFQEEINWIVSVIECYNDAIKFVEALVMLSTKTYCIEILLAFAFFIIDFIYLFQFLDMALTRSEAIKNCMYIVGSVIVIYSAFYMGQKLIDHSLSVYDKCCQIPFYKFSIKTQKIVMMLITRSLKPCSININGMMVTSHEVFAKIANTSYTFAIVCYKMR